ncbi:MAG: ABC transporter permease [bacterium]
MVSLFYYASLRHWKAEKGKVLITVLGIALGIAVFVAIRVANQSVIESFRQSIDAVSGKADLQILGGDLGIDETLYPQLLAVPGVKNISPVIQGSAAVRNHPGEILMLMGIDIFSGSKIRKLSFKKRSQKKFGGFNFALNPEAVILTERFADKYGYKVGSEIELVMSNAVRSLTVYGLMKMEGPAKAMGGNVAVMDIAFAQEYFHRLGRLDRIDVVVKPDPGNPDYKPVAEVKKRLRKIFPANIEVVRPERKNSQVDKMIGSYQLNLSAMSLIALLVGIALVNNTLSSAVAGRRTQIGILRSLGATRRQIFYLFLAEAAVLGVIGSGLGILLGHLLSYSAVGAISRTVSALYAKTRVAALVITPETVALGMAAGITASVVSSLYPARNASLTPQAETLRPGYYEITRKKQYKKYFLRGVFCLSLAYAACFVPPVRGIPLFGFISNLLIIVGVSLWIPPVTEAAGRWLTPVYIRLFKTEGIISGQNITHSLVRSSSAVAATMISLGMMLSVLIMVKSFRRTVVEWSDQNIKADFYAISGSRFAPGIHDTLPESLIGKLSRLPGVADVNGYRGIEVKIENRGHVYLSSKDLRLNRKYRRLKFLDGEEDEIFNQAIEQEGVLISESLAVKYRKARGDSLTVLTPEGDKKFTVAGVFYNYSYDRGMIALDRRYYLKYWHDHKINGLPIYLQAGANPERVKEAVLAAADEPLIIIDERTFKKEIMTTFDKTFAITYALELIAVVVSLLSIINALLISIKERRRELGILRALGFLRGQISRIVLLEASIIGFIGSALGIVLGLFMSLVLIYVINKQSFGWTIQFVFPSQAVLTATAGIFLTSLGAGWFPAKKAAGLEIAGAVHYE